MAAADDQPAPVLADVDGQTLATSQLSPSGGYTPLILSASQLPENFVLPENRRRPLARPAAPAWAREAVPERPILRRRRGRTTRCRPPSPRTKPARPSTTLAIAGAGAIEGGVIVFTITRTGALAPGTVDYTIVNGSATDGVDFQGVAGSVSFASGEASRTITIATLLDSVLEPTETFRSCSPIPPTAR